MWNYVEYERLKGEWLAQHPDATADEVQRALNELEERMGV